MEKKFLTLTVVLFLSLSLMGCQAFFDTIAREVRNLSQPSERVVEIEAAATQAVSGATLPPSPTPKVTPTLRRRSLEDLEAISTPSPTLEPESTAIQPDDTTKACDVLWRQMLAGQALLDEWYAWIAKDPPSLEKHRAALEDYEARWEAHVAQSAALGVPLVYEPIKEAYLMAVKTYWSGTHLALETLETSDQRIGPQAAALFEEANILWYEAYDQIDGLCQVARGQMPPLLDVKATITPTPTQASE